MIPRDIAIRKEMEKYQINMREWDMKAKHMRNYDDKYRVVLKFNDKESATKFIEAWNEVHK